MSVKLQPNQLLQQQIKGRFLPTSINFRSEVALTFSAVDQQTQRPVILKYYQNHEVAEIRDTIQRGVMLHAQLRSKQVLNLLDFGVHSQFGGVWCVLEHEEGHNLTRFVRTRGRVSSHECCQVLLSICRALSILHQDDKIHGNLKPTNVFIRTDRQGSHTAIISDILGGGLCRVHKDKGARFTFNDPSFFTSEQASGKAMTAQTDLGAIGLIGYFMLTGKMPFEGRTTDKILTSVIINSGRLKVNTDEIEGNADQKEVLIRIIHECLSKAPNSRPKSLSLLEEALESTLLAGSRENLGSDIGQSSSSFESPVNASSMRQQSLRTPSYNPLLNSIGFGQTMSFDAINDQVFDQLQGSQKGGTDEHIRSDVRETRSKRTLITAPPEGYAPVKEEQPHAVDPLETQTIFGSLSPDELDQIKSAQLTSTLMGQATPLPMDGDTQPIRKDELQQLQQRLDQTLDASHQPLQSPAADDWGDLSAWEGMSSDESDTSKPSEIGDYHEFVHEAGSNEINMGPLDEVSIEDLDLDSLLDEAVSALNEEAMSEDLVHPHVLDEGQRSTLFGQLMSPVQEGQEATNGQMSGSEELIEETEKLDAGLVNLAQELSLQATDQHQARDGEDDAVYRTNAALDHKADWPSFEEEEHTDLHRMGALPELFSIPASPVPAVQELSAEEETLLVSAHLNPFSDLGGNEDFTDFSVDRSGLPSGIFDQVVAEDQKMIEVGGAGLSRQLEGNISPTNREMHSELDTQLEYHHPEEIFPDVPAWRSLIALQDKPLELSKALLSIPLPLSGQLLPFSQFQLEIDGREHEEGFFDNPSVPALPHVPIVTDLAEEDELSNEVSGMWDKVDEPEVEAPLPKKEVVGTPTPPSKTSVSTAIRNILVVVLVIIAAAVGTLWQSGVDLQEMYALISGQETTSNFSTIRRTTRLEPSLDLEDEIVIDESDLQLEDRAGKVSVQQDLRQQMVKPSSSESRASAPAKTKKKREMSHETRKKRSRKVDSVPAKKSRLKASSKKEKKREKPKKKSRRRRSSEIKDPFEM